MNRFVVCSASGPQPAPVLASPSQAGRGHRLLNNNNNTKKNTSPSISLSPSFSPYLIPPSPLSLSLLFNLASSIPHLPSCICCGDWRVKDPKYVSIDESTRRRRRRLCVQYAIPARYEHYLRAADCISAASTQISSFINLFRLP